MSESGDDERRFDRRLLVVVLVLLLALFGAGIGSFVIEDRPGILPESPDPTPESASGGLSIVGDGTLLNVSDVAPGDSGVGRLTVRNTHTEPAMVEIADLSVTGSERVRAEAERAVDNSSRGELVESLLVTVSIRTVDGDVVSLYGTGDGPRPLASVARAEASGAVRLPPDTEATVVVEWRLPSSAGNRIQGDAVSLDVVLRARGPASARP